LTISRSASPDVPSKFTDNWDRGVQIGLPVNLNVTSLKEGIQRFVL
jgi:hypothetical protein